MHPRRRSAICRRLPTLSLPAPSYLENKDVFGLVEDVQQRLPLLLQAHALALRPAERAQQWGGGKWRGAAAACGGTAAAPAGRWQGIACLQRCHAALQPVQPPRGAALRSTRSRRSRRRLQAGARHRASHPVHSHGCCCCPAVGAPRSKWCARGRQEPAAACPARCNGPASK